MRKAKPKKRVILPDPVFGDQKVSKFVNHLMYDGKKHKLYGGLMYSPTVSVGLLLGFDFHGINIGYSYEAYTGGVGALNGTHEIVIGYQTDLNKFKKGKNMHKSVRLL